MKKLLFVLSICVGVLAWMSFRPAEKVTLIYKMKLCEEVQTMYLYKFNGINFETVNVSKRAEDGSFSFNIEGGEPRFLYVGVAENNITPVIVGEEEKVVLEGECRRVRNADIVQSEANKAYVALGEDMKEMQARTTQLIMSVRKNRQDSAKMAEIVRDFDQLDKDRLALLEKWYDKDPLMGRILALNTYLSYYNNGQGYENEPHYFAREYFSQVDWSAPAYNHMPWVYEAVKSYTETLCMLRLPDHLHTLFLNTFLEEIPQDSRTYQLALGGMVTGLQAKQHANFMPFAKKFVEKYKTSAPKAADAIEAQINQMGAMVVGGEAPDFTQETPEGEELSLSDFRGKVVLIDFWASWCGPCRRENPNVVRMYNKYKDEGFEILGVSLDRDKSRWINAIEKDGLTWPHVSDLKGWQNEVAQTYGVRSIPHTILLDKEGRIIARNLRGPGLEQKLQEIFGTP